VIQHDSVGIGHGRIFLLAGFTHYVGGHPKPSPAPATPLEGLIGIAAPGCGDEVESRRDRFGHAMLGGPFSPGAIERDSVRVRGSALGRASTRGRPAVRV
jgi:hypothetical protein